MTAAGEQFVYLTTIGRKTGMSREIEIWFVERDGRVYILAEHGNRAHWVQNIVANPSVILRLADVKWKAAARVLDPNSDADLFSEVRELARKKYGWGDGLPVEFCLERQLQD